ncbi:MAG: hypothetical protein ACLP7Q_23675 [Isosphaeraceae bacterium]
MSERSPDDAAVLNAWIAKGDCNPSVAKEWLEQKQMEFARTEQLPASESLTVGEMIDLVTVLDRLRSFAVLYPSLALQLFRRDEVLRKSEGFQGFLVWKDIKFHRGTVIEAAKEFLALLVDRFQKRSEELRQMPLLDAVRLLTQPENAPKHIERENNPPETPAELPDLVRLDQAAALVNRSSSALRHYRSKGMPKPYVQGTKGKPNEYLWSQMHPWLENTFNRKISEVEILKFRTS